MAKHPPNAAGRAARKRAEVTPPVVLDAMLAGPVEFGGITLHPLSLDIIWVLQKCEHPAFDAAGSGQSDLTPLQIAQLVYAFAAPSSAVATVTQGELGQSAFDAEALAFFRRHVPMPQTKEVLAIIARLIRAGYATAPSGGNPPKAGPA